MKSAHTLAVFATGMLLAAPGNAEHHNRDIKRYQAHILPAPQIPYRSATNGVFATVTEREFVFTRRVEGQTNLGAGIANQLASSNQGRRRLAISEPRSTSEQPPTATEVLAANNHVAVTGKEVMVHFAFNSAQLDAAARQRLLDRLPEFREASEILVTGHTDNTGGATYNLLLSQKRANSVKELLVTQGVSGSKIRLFAAGYDQPIESNDTPAGRSANRRVIVVF